MSFLVATDGKRITYLQLIEARGAEKAKTREEKNEGAHQLLLPKPTPPQGRYPNRATDPQYPSGNVLKSPIALHGFCA
jgi:hypothetical protein